MDKKDFRFAKLIVDYFADKITAKFAIEKRYQRLVAIDDDVFSAFVAAWYYHRSKRKFGYCPKIDTIGGYGLMSSRINPKKDGKRLSEAEMLVDVLLKLGVAKDDIGIVCSDGTNTGQNLAAYANSLKQRDCESQKVLFCTTKRLAGRLWLTQIKQQPQLDADYVWADSDLGECQLYNGKGLAGGLPYLSEVASIYDRYIRYAYPKEGKPQFMAKLGEPLSHRIAIMGSYLSKRYLLKMPGVSLLKMWQFVITYGDFLLHKKAVRQNLEENIRFWQNRLEEKFDLWF